jgi:hypothetical protein
MEEFNPQFNSYSGSQNIVTADRVIILGKEDAVFVLGKKAVSIASPGRVNIDSDIGVTIRAPLVKLGLTGYEVGEPVLLGYQTSDVLLDLVNSLNDLSNSLSTISETNWAVAASQVQIQGSRLKETCNSILNRINYLEEKKSFILSKTTFTK